MSIDPESYRFYTEGAQKYADHVRDPYKSLWHTYYEKPAMYALLPELHEMSVLSLGCGSGEDSIFLKRGGARRSVGIDISPQLIEIAKRSYAECEFFVMDMDELDFEDETFDFVYSSLAMHYVENWQKVFTKVHRVTKPGATFLFSCTHPLRLAMEQKNEAGEMVRKIEIRRTSDSSQVEVTGDYFTKRKVSYRMGKEDIVNLWHVSLTEISRILFDTGFYIERIVEPQPLPEFAQYDRQSYERLCKIPEFIIFKVRKNSANS